MNRTGQVLVETWEDKDDIFLKSYSRCTANGLTSGIVLALCSMRGDAAGFLVHITSGTHVEVDSS